MKCAESSRCCVGVRPGRLGRCATRVRCVRSTPARCGVRGSAPDAIVTSLVTAWLYRQNVFGSSSEGVAEALGVVRRVYGPGIARV